MAMHGFSSHSGSGGGGGSGPVDYMTDDKYYDKEQGVWQPRDPLPKVIEGDPRLMVQMIDALDHKHRYTSGVLSFTKADTEKLNAAGLDASITDITGRLKDMLFAGISEEHRNILIIAHTHLDRLELHYVLPRHNYEVDRAWNPAPPGEAKFRQMDALVDFVNVKYGLDDPRDPLRARATKEVQWEPTDKKTTRETINKFFKEAVIEGMIDSREQLISLAKEAGFEITRTGENYVSMRPPGSDKAIRLKGEIYDRKFTSSTELTDTKTKGAERTSYLAKPAVAERYKQAVRERQNFIEKRFKKILNVVRAGKNYSETQKFNSTKRGSIITIRENRPSNFTNNLGNPPTNNNNKVNKNDGFGKEADAVIARAERVIYSTQQSATTASRVLEAGTKIAQSAHTRATSPTVKSLYRAPRSTPLASVGTAGLAISDVAGGIAGADTGDADSDRILTAKRQEAVESAQRSATRAKQDALRNQRKIDDDLSI
jgi:hypothetical protein